MALSVNTNLASLYVQSDLVKNQNSLQTSVQRLSSGLRINSPADDASGYAITNRMSTIIDGLSTSIRNTNDGISYSQTVSGALYSLQNNLQRMREIAIQSLNDSNSNTDKTYASQEYNQLMADNVRIQATTTFNGANVFNQNNTTIQVGYRNNFQDRINLSNLSLTNTTAVGTTSIVDTQLSTEAADLGVVINAAAATVDGSGNTTATYTTVLNSVVSSINSSNKLNVTQKSELVTLATDLSASEASIHAGVKNFASDLNRLMGSNLSPLALSPASPVNVSISASTLSAINSAPSIASSISTVLSRVAAAGSISAANTTAQQIVGNPYLTASGQANILASITAVYNQFVNSGNTSVATFASDLNSLLLGGSHSTSTPGVTVTDGLSTANRAIEQSDPWYTSSTTMQDVMSNSSYSTISSLTSALTNSINSSGLSSSIKTTLVNSINSASSFANSNSVSFSTFTYSLQNLLSSGSMSMGGSFFSDGLTTTERNTEQSNIWYTLTSFQGVLNNGSYNSISQLTPALTNSISNSGLSNTIKTALTNAINTLSTQDTMSSTSYSTFKTQVQNLLANGSVVANPPTISLNAADIASITATPTTPLSTFIGSAINNGGATFSNIAAAASNEFSVLYNAGVISSTVQTDLNNANTNLYNQSGQTLGTNTTVAQYTADLNTLLGSGAVGQIGPFTSTDSFQTTPTTYQQLRFVPVAPTSDQNATVAVNKLDAALTEIAQASALQGAIQNRFASIISDLQAFSMSQNSSRAIISGVDIAQETTNLAKSQILQRSDAAMLTQANSTPKAVIALLNVTSVSNMISTSDTPTGDIANVNQTLGISSVVSASNFIASNNLA